MSCRCRNAIRLQKLSLFGLVAVLLAISACDNAPAANTDENAHRALPELSDEIPAIKNASYTEDTRRLVRETFDSIQSIQERIRNQGLSSWMIKTDEVRISLAEYVLTMKSKELIHALNPLTEKPSNEKPSNEKPSNEKPSDEEVLRHMITEALTVHHAKEIGITVTPEEVRDVIDLQMRAMKDTDPKTSAEQLTLYIMEQRIRITGLSEEDFWNSEELYSAYEAAIYMNKLRRHILADEDLNGMESYEALQAKLYKDFRIKHRIQVPDLSELETV
ncbi:MULTISPECIES: SurA N-terminal domain-containing protein [Paenibacillus]|uniref:SurA N-terminal domain-containing protein n=1 Tax=Paenibacillus TaxID=44249 RepID=UPI00048E0120|nr:SurA N-terminal domain-containing protein [Paenibacillus sp. IHBB 10380]